MFQRVSYQIVSIMNWRSARHTGQFAVFCQVTKRTSDQHGDVTQKQWRCRTSDFEEERRYGFELRVSVPASTTAKVGAAKERP